MSDPLAHIRAEVMAQPEADRLDYALDILRFHLDPVPAFYEGCHRLGLGLANAEIRMLHALDAKRARFVSLNGLLAARCLDVSSDDWPSPDRVVGGIAAIRKRLEFLGLPVVITTWRGVGYCLEAPAVFQFEFAALPEGVTA